MALDGAYLYKIRQEIDELAGGRIDKISQPTHDSIVIALRGFGGGNRRLLVSAESSGATLQFTRSQVENPKTAPMFCMLLRKHLGSGKLLRTEQSGLDRVVSLVFECQNELGDKVELSLVCEIMGRRSNIILVNNDGKVIDAIKRVDFVTSEVRQILSGITYQLPPAQQKLNLLITPPFEIVASITAGRDIPLSKAILEQVEGFSPALAREIAYRACGDNEPTAAQLDPDHRKKLTETLATVHTLLAGEGSEPTIVSDETGKQIEFSFLPLNHYPASYPRTTGASCSELLDRFLVGKDIAESMKQRSGDLHKLLINVRERLGRKLAAQRQELLAAADRDKKREFGDIIAANIYQMNKGDEILRTVNFFDPEGSEIEIPLDPMLSPSRNAQRYYGEYRKAATAEAKLNELVESGEQELEYLSSVLVELSLATTDAELAAIRDEVSAQGYARRTVRDRQKPQKLSYHKYISSDGFVILSGRTNLQNDQLTLRDADNRDLWLHTQKIHGSHTVILTEGEREIPNLTIEEAAVIAACNSAAGRSLAKVPVDYTTIRNVKKPRGARPGMVIYDNYETAMVLPDRQRAEALRTK